MTASERHPFPVEVRLPSFPVLRRRCLSGGARWSSGQASESLSASAISKRRLCSARPSGATLVATTTIRGFPQPSRGGVGRGTAEVRRRSGRNPPRRHGAAAARRSDRAELSACPEWPTKMLPARSNCRSTPFTPGAMWRLPGAGRAPARRSAARCNRRSGAAMNCSILTRRFSPKRAFRWQPPLSPRPSFMPRFASGAPAPASLLCFNTGRKRPGAPKSTAKAKRAPFFRRSFRWPPERALALARAELRMPPDYPATPLAEVLPGALGSVDSRSALAYAAAVAGSAPRAASFANLLPAGTPRLARPDAISVAGDPRDPAGARFADRLHRFCRPSNRSATAAISIARRASLNPPHCARRRSNARSTRTRNRIAAAG